MIYPASFPALLLAIAMACVATLLFLASGVAGMLLLWLPLHAMALAFRLMESDEPVLTVGVNGLVLSSKITSDGLIEWRDVKSLELAGFGFPFLSVLSFHYLVIKTHRPLALDRVGKLFLPSRFFRTYAIPARLVRGGPAALQQMLTLLERIRRDERHAAAHRGHGSGPAAGLPAMDEMAWHMLRNLSFPFDAKTIGWNELEQAALADLFLTEVGVHRDLLPPEFERDLRQQPVMQQLAQRAVEIQKSARPPANVPMLNGKPLQPIDRR
jgi:hypothetical protein